MGTHVFDEELRLDDGYLVEIVIGVVAENHIRPYLPVVILLPGGELDILGELAALIMLHREIALIILLIPGHHDGMHFSLRILECFLMDGSQGIPHIGIVSHKGNAALAAQGACFPGPCPLLFINLDGSLVDPGTIGKLGFLGHCRSCRPQPVQSICHRKILVFNLGMVRLCQPGFHDFLFIHCFFYLTQSANP